MEKRSYPAGRPASDPPQRAVIDIGSNTVRLVVYAGGERVPETVINEKVTARLGKDLSDGGLISEKSAEIALAGIERFHLLVEALGIDDVTVVATAAAREAKNGAAFLDRVRAIGFEPRLLSGEEEAIASASGVLSAFPGAHGVVADLGGGSLELVSVEDGGCHQGVSLPFGTLQLGSLRKKGSRAFKGNVHKTFAKVGWAVAHPGPLYLVGGTWRAFARLAMLRTGSPLDDPHAFELAAGEADRIAHKLQQSTSASLKEIGGLASVRAEALPDAAALLRVMLAELEPSGLVFSSWGLREGLLYLRSSPLTRKLDPFLAGVSHFTVPMGGSPSRAAAIAGWTSAANSQSSTRQERLRMGSIMLALAAARVEPNLRLNHALDWALHKRWVGISMHERGELAAALAGSCGSTALPAELLALTDERKLHRALGWGLATRLCRRLNAGSHELRANCRLVRSQEVLTLEVHSSIARLVNDAARSDLAALASWYGLEDRVVIGEFSEG